jgi:hypothetical protein
MHMCAALFGALQHLQRHSPTGTPTLPPGCHLAVAHNVSLLCLPTVPHHLPPCLCIALQGWEYGVASDTDPEWQRRAGQLRAYHRQHGDTSVGFRDGDDPELAR